jgi:outer membrane protein assembly factor BamA
VLIPGFYGGRQILRERVRVAVDLRDHARDGSGVAVALDASYVRGLLRDPSHHVRLALETVVALGGLDRALILRGLASAVQPLGSSFIAFDEMVVSSGAAGLRGFPEGRLRDRSGLVGTVEWRWLIAPRIDATLFTDVGTVAGQWFDDVRASKLFANVGAGLRFYDLSQPRYWAERETWGVQIAYARETGFRLLLSLAAF